MYIVKQVCKRLIRLTIFILIYLLSALVLIGIFSAIYLFVNVPDPWIVSESVFWQVEYPDFAPRNIVIMQIVVKDMLFVIWLGTLLAKLLQPVNPIVFPSYIVCTNQQYKFRYWIMLPAHQFLYDINIRILLSEKTFYNGGINRIHPLWELDSEIQNLNYARGVRFVLLSKEDSQSLYTAMKKQYAKNKQPLFLTILIRGCNNSGNLFYNRRTYRVNGQILSGYDFASIRQPGCIRIAQSLGYKGKQAMHYSLIRYQNFNKVYRNKVHCNEEQEGCHPQKRHLLDTNHLAEGQFSCKLLQILVDLFNYAVGSILDRNAASDFTSEQKR